MSSKRVLLDEHYTEEEVEVHGNDMVAAMNKMVEKDDWGGFELWTQVKKFESSDGVVFIPWLMQPERFFQLMGEWLERRKNGLQNN